MARIRKVILMIDASRAYCRQLLRGIAKYSRFHGPWVFDRKPPYYRRPADWLRALSRRQRLDADGIIMVEQEHPEQIAAMGLPMIASPYVEERIAGVPNIIGDTQKMGEMAAEHLLERGFRQFAYCGFEDMFGARSRGESFRKTIAAAGFETHFYEQPRARVKRAWEDEQNLMADWLKSLPKPVGVMTCTDDRSQDVIEACKIAGLHAPEQVAVIGVDNDELVCELSNPPLSSIALNAERAGYEAAELLDRMMSGEKCADKDIIVEPTHVVTRQSTDILAIEDSDVGAAVRFIRQHARLPIQVSDVVEAAALSRRGLEVRFKRIVGRSIHEEIKRCRIEQLETMLLETDLSISRLATVFDYPGVEKLSRYFQREKGLTPLAYRKKYGKKQPR